MAGSESACDGRGRRVSRAAATSFGLLQVLDETGKVEKVHRSKLVS